MPIIPSGAVGETTLAGPLVPVPTPFVVHGSVSLDLPDVEVVTVTVTVPTATVYVTETEEVTAIIVTPTPTSEVHRRWPSPDWKAINVELVEAARQALKQINAKLQAAINAIPIGFIIPDRKKWWKIGVTLKPGGYVRVADYDEIELEELPSEGYSSWLLAQLQQPGELDSESSDALLEGFLASLAGNLGPEFVDQLLADLEPVHKDLEEFASVIAQVSQAIDVANHAAVQQAREAGETSAQLLELEVTVDKADDEEPAALVGRSLLKLRGDGDPVTEEPAPRATDETVVSWAENVEEWARPSKLTAHPEWAAEVKAFEIMQEYRKRLEAARKKVEASRKAELAYPTSTTSDEPAPEPTGNIFESYLENWKERARKYREQIEASRKAELAYPTAATPETTMTTTAESTPAESTPAESTPAAALGKRGFPYLSRFPEYPPFISKDPKVMAEQLTSRPESASPTPLASLVPDFYPPFISKDWNYPKTGHFRPAVSARPTPLPSWNPAYPPWISKDWKTQEAALPIPDFSGKVHGPGGTGGAKSTPASDFSGKVRGDAQPTGGN